MSHSVKDTNPITSQNHSSDGTGVWGSEVCPPLRPQGWRNATEIVSCVARRNCRGFISSSVCHKQIRFGSAHRLLAIRWQRYCSRDGEGGWISRQRRCLQIEGVLNSEMTKIRAAIYEFTSSRVDDVGRDVFSWCATVGVRSFPPPPIKCPSVTCPLGQRAVPGQLPPLTWVG